MCGIAGIVLLPAGSVTDPRRCLLRMRETMRHRGPDDSGLFLSPDGRAGLVNRRLAIRDLSPAGHMPMGAADDTIQEFVDPSCYPVDHRLHSPRAN
jgi:asparagine synthase (glutamine-hydrolysing)